MRSPHRAVLIAAFGVALGCASPSQQVVGVWKGDIIPASVTKPAAGDSEGDKLGKALAEGVSGFLKEFVGPLTLEFNADGRYKASVRLGSSTGTYTVSGDVITLTPDEKNSSKTNLDLKKLQISSDGKTLSTVKEFKTDSDAQLVLKKQ